MTIQHHPSELLLTAFAAGTLDLGAHIAVATHLVACAECRKWWRTLERVGGAVLEAMPLARMSNDALARAISRLDLPLEAADPDIGVNSAALDTIPGLPEFVRKYPVGEWKFVAPRLYKRAIHVPDPGDTRVFLLRAGAGVRLQPHTHTGTELTCVLTGSFSHDGMWFGAGDIDLGDSDISHDIAVGQDGDCICLVAMSGELRLKGLRGRLMQPFVSI